MGGDTSHVDAAFHLLCVERGWRSQRLDDHLYMFEGSTDTLLRVDDSLTAPLVAVPPDMSLKDSLAAAAGQATQPPSTSRSEATAHEWVVPLNLLGVRVDVRCVHKACADGVKAYFSALLEPTPGASPEAVVWCSWPTAERYLFRARDDTADGTPLDGVVVQTLGRPSAQWTSSQQPLPPSVERPFRDQFIALHAATVRTANGRGVLLAGERGAGKTTAALSLANEHGAELLADETAFVRCRTAIVEPFPHAVGVWHDGRKSQVPVTDVCGSISREAVEVSQLIFLSCRPGPAGVQQIRPEDSLRHLLPHHRHGGADAGQAMATLFKLSSEVSAWTVSYADHRDLGTLVASVC